jgi:hypothetical protein
MLRFDFGIVQEPTIRICIASFQAAALPRMARDGSPVGPIFFLPVPVLARLFRRLFLDYLTQAFDAGELQFSSSLEPLRIQRSI